MASPPEIPGDVILIESSDDEEFVKGRKRSRRSVARSPASSSGSSQSSAPSAKRMRRSSSTGPASNDATGSEEGEIGESRSSHTQEQTQQLGSHGGEQQAPDRREGALPLAEGQPAHAEKAQEANQGPALGGAGGPRGAQQGNEASDAAGGLESGVFMAEHPPIWHHGPASFKLPSLPQTRAGTWSSRIEDWVQLLTEGNADHAASVTPSLAVTAWSFYLENFSGLKSGKKKNARQAAKDALKTGALVKQLGTAHQSGPEGLKVKGAAGAASSAKTSEAERSPSEADGMAGVTSAKGAADSMSAKAAEATRVGSHSNGTASRGETKQVSPPSADDMDTMRKYFPSIDDVNNFCLSCACNGHTSANCPGLRCRFCHEGHRDIHCPTRQRCKKCRQLGHASSACTWKPGMALGGDELICAFCAATDHFEKECRVAWRGYRIEDVVVVNKVASIPVSCAICGKGDHYFSDCSKRRYPANPIFSLAYHARCTDPNSKLLSIVAASEAAAKERASGAATSALSASTRGHDGPNTIIHYSESDDTTDSELLGAETRPRKSATVTSRMRLSSNIQMPAGPTRGNRSRGGSNQRGQFRGQAAHGAQTRPAGAAAAAQAPARGRGGFSMGMGTSGGGRRGYMRGGGGGGGGYHSVPPPPGVSDAYTRGEHSGGSTRGGRGGRGGRGRGQGRGRGSY